MAYPTLGSYRPGAEVHLIQFNFYFAVLAGTDVRI